MKEYRITVFWSHGTGAVPPYSKNLGDLYSMENLIHKKAQEWFEIWWEENLDHWVTRAWVEYEEI